MPLRCNMSKITAIEVQKSDKERCNLFVDGSFFAGVSIEIVIKNHLKVGTELDKNSLGDLVFSAEKEKALKKAIDYVSKSLKTRKQVKDYLEKKGYAIEIILKILDKLIDYGLINDVEYAKRYIESTSKKQGQKLIEYKLMAKGVKKDDIALAYANVEDFDKDRVYNLAVKHLKNKERTRENLAKTYKYLLGKGFLYEEIDGAISRLKSEE